MNLFTQWQLYLEMLKQFFAETFNMQGVQFPTENTHEDA